MLQQLLLAAVSFCLGSLLTAITLVGAFGSRVAVLESRADNTNKQVGKLERAMEVVKQDLNGLGALFRRHRPHHVTDD